ACPAYFSSDGGFHRNTDMGGGCQTPSWARSNVGLHATWLWSMAGVDRPGDANENLYFGLQDDGPFATTNVGATDPTTITGHNEKCCDAFDVAADNNNHVLYTDCCFSPGRATLLFLSNNADMSGSSSLGGTSYPPDGLVPEPAEEPPDGLP